MDNRKYVYLFGEHTDAGLLGGKGANLGVMASLGIPVPPGFTITTEACREFYARGDVPEGLGEQIEEALTAIISTGKKFGDPQNPLLVSVRSGAKFSMPGMMDTILNVGLNREAVAGLTEKTGNERYVLDCYRRLIQTYSDIVLGVGRHLFEAELEVVKRKLGVKNDSDIDAESLKDLVKTYLNIVVGETGREFPEDPYDQLFEAVVAVFKSWNSDRAVEYRRIYGIPDDLGTAVNVQTMVFGNLNEKSGTGVAFTRSPSTGENKLFAEYLPNAQGEDVVAGVRTPVDVAGLCNAMPMIYAELESIYHHLEKHYRDMLDLEFTVEDGKLWMLQVRMGKRTAVAALRIATDMVAEGLISEREAVLRVNPELIKELLVPTFEAEVEKRASRLTKGLPAGPGAAAGPIAFNAQRAVEMKRQGRPAILVRAETSPDDIRGMEAACGILTARGGMTSHAAVIARGMNKPCVVGCGELNIDETAGRVVVGDELLREGEEISINGSNGSVYKGVIPHSSAEIMLAFQGIGEETDLYKRFVQLMSWADNYRRLGVHANADTPEDAHLARKFGAEGIGLCRTEHMFFNPTRLPIMQRMIMADPVDRRKILNELLLMQKGDFKSILWHMEGLPVTIRLLDPPLHEFLPKREELIEEIVRMEMSDTDPLLIEAKGKILARINSLHEFNPMLGLRGCRLGITMPEVTEMQVRAILEAACELALEGVKAKPEIMVPLVSMSSEFEDQLLLVIKTAEQVMEKFGVKIDYRVGTMIETPRGAITAGRIAQKAEFFSFGTNDLTQMTYGFSRDDTVGVINAYRQKGLLEDDPFVTLDRDGVGMLMRMAVEQGRKVNPELKIGICGEHGGDPRSISFCDEIGLDYVSASGKGVLVARLAAAHSHLKGVDLGLRISVA